MDNLTYGYNKSNGLLQNNRLCHVKDAVSDANYSEDLDIQPADNYDYDAIGNLTRDNKEGISRLGVVQGNRDMDQPYQVAPEYVDLLGATYSYGLQRGNKRYELNNHLGNVLATISDRKIAVPSQSNSSLIGYYRADVVSAQDYYPFGMQMPGRTVASGAYRYGFNGKENDNEVKGEGNQQDYGMRIYDPRLGRFLSVDPLTKEYPWYTPYQFAGNKPIWAIDLDGAEEEYKTIVSRSIEQAKLKLLQANQKQHQQRYPAGHVLMKDIYGTGHIGPEAVVKQKIAVIRNDYNNAVGDNIRGGLGGAIGYKIGGDRGSFVGAAVDNIALSFAGIPGESGFLTKPQSPTMAPKIANTEAPSGILKLEPSVVQVMGNSYRTVGEVTVLIKNTGLLNSLNRTSKGDWVKVYEAGLLDGNKIETHYFRNNDTKEVFDVKTKYNFWHQKAFKNLSE